eukprot:g5688.t1
MYKFIGHKIATTSRETLPLTLKYISLSCINSKKNSDLGYKVIRTMDLSDDDDFDVPGSAYGTNSSSRNSGSRLIKTQAQVERERFKKQETYENKARSQRQERIKSLTNGR